MKTNTFDNKKTYVTTINRCPNRLRIVWFCHKYKQVMHKVKKNHVIDSITDDNNDIFS